MTSRQAARALGATLIILAGCVTACKAERASAPVRVAAAADLMNAFEELGRAFERESGQKVVFSFGSTGLLARQLREGAPFDVFAAANVAFVDAVVAAGACDGSTKAPYARGRIAIWSRQRSAIAPPASLDDLADERFTYIAIANPEHAPYGQAAKEALMTAGIWERAQPRLVYGENVRQTLQFAETGNADAAIVALALVIHDRANPWTLLAERLHQPIDQALVVCRHGAAAEGGRAFAAYINSAAGRAVMRRYGFLLPGETTDTPP